MVLKSVAVIAGAFCALANVAFAESPTAPVASVMDLSGKVMVNAGQGFAPASQALALKAGDRLLVGENAFATLSFKTCTVSLTKPTVFTVSDTPPCDGALVQPVADLPGGGAYPPGGAGLPPVGGIPPFVTTLAFVGPLAVGCAIKCGDLLDNEEAPATAD